MVQTRSSKRRTRQSHKKTAKVMSTPTKQELRTPTQRADKARPRSRVNSPSNNLKKEDFKCAICQEIYVHPFKLPCRHIFCFMCLDEASRTSTLRQTCPYCRAEMDGFPLRAKEVYDSIEILFSKLGIRQRKHYMRLLRQAQSQFRRRNRSVKKVKNLHKVGYKLENAWYVGLVFFQDNKIYVFTEDFRKNFIFNGNTCNVDHLRKFDVDFTSLKPVIYADDLENIRDIERYNFTQEDIQPDRTFLRRLASSQVMRNHNSSLRKPKASQR